MTTDTGNQTKKSSPGTEATGKGSLSIEYRGVRLSLSPERCIYLPTSDKLILSDVHLGKEAVFQRHGLGIPDGIATADISRINKLLQSFEPRELMILGDLVHTLPQTRESWLPAFANLVEDHPQTSFHVVTGNHDKPGTHKLLPATVNWHQEIIEDNMRFTHFPRFTGPAGWQQLASNRQTIVVADNPSAKQSVESDSNLNFAGHIHPSYVLKARGKKNSLRMPAYWFSGNQIVLPAFGEFTGTHNITALPGDSIYGVGPDAVIPMPVPESAPISADNAN